MREAFAERFGPEITNGVVEVSVCADWGEKLSLGSAKRLSCLTLGLFI
jgi:hypothetical protein